MILRSRFLFSHFISAIEILVKEVHGISAGGSPLSSDLPTHLQNYKTLRVRRPSFAPVQRSPGSRPLPSAGLSCCALVSKPHAVFPGPVFLQAAAAGSSLQKASFAHTAAAELPGGLIAWCAPDLLLPPSCRQAKASAWRGVPLVVTPQPSAEGSRLSGLVFFALSLVDVTACVSGSL